MTALRLLATAGVAAAVAAFGAGLVPALRLPQPPPPVAAAASTPAPTRPEEPPRALTGPDLHEVPAGVLARAADARALERTPVCRPAARSQEPACAPQRGSVEIQWDVAREP